MEPKPMCARSQLRARRKDQPVARKPNDVMKLPPPQADLEDQLRAQRRTVDFDTFDIHTKQLIQMLKDNEIHVSPKYQRKFRWEDDRCSQFIESLMLGIPVPSLFMATNKENDWELVDGVQRLSTLVYFAGSQALREGLNLGEGRTLKHSLALTGLKKLALFDGLTFDQLPKSIQLQFNTRPIKVITLNDKSDTVVRFDLFERLNTGGVVLSAQEIRDCIYQGRFADQIEKWAADKNFRKVLKLTQLQRTDATGEECVLRFFAFRNRYRTFVHDVRDFLNDYMEDASGEFDYESAEQIFGRTFAELARVFPDGLRRQGKKVIGSTTPLNLFEGVAVGASFALDQIERLPTAGLNEWLASDELRDTTTGATNSQKAVKGRIEFCRDRFLGKSYVPRPRN
jgi:hypothetical protein